MLVSLGAAALAAILVLVTTRAVIVLQNQEAQDKAAEFARYKLETEKKIANANEKAEAERLARVRIEEKIAPRSLNSEQQMRIAEQLKSFSGRDTRRWLRLRLMGFRYGERSTVHCK